MTLPQWGTVRHIAKLCDTEIQGNIRMTKNRWKQPCWVALRDAGIPESDFPYYTKLPGLVSDLVQERRMPSADAYAANLCGLAAEAFKRVPEAKRTARMVEMFNRLDGVGRELGRKLRAAHIKRKQEQGSVRAAVVPASICIPSSVAVPLGLNSDGTVNTEKRRRGRPRKDGAAVLSRAVRFSVDEVERITAAARLAGVSFSGFIRIAVNARLCGGQHES